MGDKAASKTWGGSGAVLSGRRVVFAFTALSFGAHVLDHLSTGQKVDPLFGGAMALALVMVVVSALSVSDPVLGLLGIVLGGTIVAGSVAFHVIPAPGTDPTQVTGLVALVAASCLCASSASSLRKHPFDVRGFSARRYVR